MIMKKFTASESSNDMTEWNPCKDEIAELKAISVLVLNEMIDIAKSEANSVRLIIEDAKKHLDVDVASKNEIKQFKQIVSNANDIVRTCNRSIRDLIAYKGAFMMGKFDAETDGEVLNDMVMSLKKNDYIVVDVNQFASVIDDLGYIIK
jgi:hypothetical protein